MVAYWISVAVGALLGLAVFVVLAWRLARLEHLVRRLEGCDALTGAASRTAFFDALARETHRCRAAEAPLSVAVLDCDSFKQVNDSFGHCVGDAVLATTAHVLLHWIKPPGMVARLWGDAFAILLPQVPLEGVRDLLSDVKRDLDVRMAEHEWPVTFSIGAATFETLPEDANDLLPAAVGQPFQADCSLPEDANDLLPAADALMYSVKRHGRNGLFCRRVKTGSSGTISPSSAHGGPNPFVADAARPEAVTTL